MKDKQFKLEIADYFRQDFDSSRFDFDFKPDYAISNNLDSTLHIFEYENSSRGLVHNLTKIAMYFHSIKDHDPVTVYLIRTLHHQHNHKQDYDRALFLSKKLGHFKLEFKIIDEQDLEKETHELRLDIESEDIMACGGFYRTKLEEYLDDC
jgi:hypothetical protein